MNEQRMRNSLQEGYRQLFSSYPNEVMITLHFGRRIVRNETAYKYLRAFVTKVEKFRKTQIAGFAVYNNLRSPHAHMLLFGKSKKINNLLNGEMEKFWGLGSVHVENEIDAGAAFYLAQNITSNCPEKSDVFPFNMRELKKYRMHRKHSYELSIEDLISNFPNDFVKIGAKNGWIWQW
jgi:hypothetical protein